MRFLCVHSDVEIDHSRHTFQILYSHFLWNDNMFGTISITIIQPSIDTNVFSLFCGLLPMVNAMVNHRDGLFFGFCIYIFICFKFSLQRIGLTLKCIKPVKIWLTWNWKTIFYEEKRIILKYSLYYMYSCIFINKQSSIYIIITRIIIIIGICMHQVSQKLQAQQQ